MSHRSATMFFRATILMLGFSVPGCAFSITGPHTEDIASTLSQRAARTTTITEEFEYTLKYPAGLSMMYNGQRGSRIEPCGCRALNLGGIDREAAMVGTLRRANPSSLYIDAGGFFREFTDPPLRLQTWHMMQALRELGIQAINIGYPDLQQGMATLLEFQRRFELPYISANIINSDTGETVFPGWKTIEVPRPGGGAPLRIAVVGITALNRDTSRGGAEPRMDDDGGSRPQLRLNGGAAPAANRARWMIAETNGRLPGYGGDAGMPESKALPIYYDTLRWQAGMDDHAVDMEGGGASPGPAAGGSSPALEFAVKGSDAFASAAAVRYRVEDPMMAARALGEKLRTNHDFVVLLAFVGYGTALKMAPELKSYDVIIAADYLDHTEPARPVADGPLVVGGEYDGISLGLIEVPLAEGKTGAAEATQLPILQSIRPDPAYSHYISDFAHETAALPVEEVVPPAERLYAGSTSCRMCHAEAFTQWKTHHHSRAMKALVDKNMQYNPDCLKCHVVAYRQPGGFVDLRVSANLANVQCEVCHGPGEKHVQEMRAVEALKREGKPSPPVQNGMQMQWDRKFCMQCHDPANDPQFNFEQDIQRVRHKNPAPPRERPTTVSLSM